MFESCVSGETWNHGDQGRCSGCRIPELQGGLSLARACPAPAALPVGTGPAALGHLALLPGGEHATGNCESLEHDLHYLSLLSLPCHSSCVCDTVWRGAVNVPSTHVRMILPNLLDLAQEGIVVNNCKGFMIQKDIFLFWIWELQHRKQLCYPILPVSAGQPLPVGTSAESRVWLTDHV